jgi:hypothetical protein
MNINKNLSNFFNIDNNNQIETSKVPSLGGTFDNNNFQKDYELAQDNLKKLINTGDMALQNALNVATESDSPRAFEVVAILLKTMADLNNNMLDVHKKAKDTTNTKTEVKQTNNSVFIGSTTDLQNILNKERSTEKVIDVEVMKDEQKQ